MGSAQSGGSPRTVGLPGGVVGALEATAEEVDAVAARCERNDLGGLLIPRENGVKVGLRRAGDAVSGVTLLNGATALQLQAFRSDGSRPWDAVRAEIRATVRWQGGEAEDWAGDAGVELRATVPVTTPSGGWGMQTVRMLGCDGPGWLLRGVISGEGAAPDSRSSWVYETFFRIVVDSTSPVSGSGVAIELRGDG
ncbi:DUF3710 domain-containing protein [Streptomyces atriruber]|uniref:DUF3710 domain-containing protein n=1 Tax=Streptomyces atriruber TaxID=545121 RepID=A0ABV3BKP1_9ACTN